MKAKKGICSTYKEPYNSIINEEPCTCVKCGRRDLSFFEIIDFEIKDNKVKLESVYCLDYQLASEPKNSIKELEKFISE